MRRSEYGTWNNPIKGQRWSTRRPEKTIPELEELYDIKGWTPEQIEVAKWLRIRLLSQDNGFLALKSLDDIIEYYGHEHIFVGKDTTINNVVSEMTDSQRFTLRTIVGVSLIKSHFDHKKEVE